jgi:hypothetical protein
MPKRQSKHIRMRYQTLPQSEVPQGRHGKHKPVISLILDDLDRLKDGAALKVPLSELREGKAKVRSALNRAARKAGRTVVTASDSEFLYIWNATRSTKGHQP